MSASALRPFARPRLWLGVWMFGWCLAVVLSLVPQVPLPTGVPDSDKIGHLLAYFTLSAWAVNVFARPRGWWLAALALVALGIAMELAQGAFTHSRMQDPRDALANTMGVGLGLLVGLGRLQFAVQALDRRWFGRAPG